MLLAYQNSQISYLCAAHGTFPFFIMYLLIYFLAALDLRCFAHAFSSYSERGLLFVVVHRLLTAVASLVAEHGLYSTGSVVVAHGLSCSTACGIFPDQGSNHVPCIGRRDS